MKYYVYIIASKSDGMIYIGVTNSLERRIYEHKNHLIDGFTKKYKITKLVYYEEFESAEFAITREKQLKNWHRGWKINLIESVNPNWKDLYHEGLDPETSSG
jgi:putative endonuclease